MNKYTWDGYKPESSPKNEEVKKEEKVENSTNHKKNDVVKRSIKSSFNYKKNS